MYQQERWSRFSYRIRGRVIRAVIRIGLFIRGFRLRLTAVIRCRGCPDTYMAAGGRMRPDAAAETDGITCLVRERFRGIVIPTTRRSKGQ